MLEQLVMDYINQNNRYKDYLIKYKDTLTTEELEIFKKNMELEFKEQLKTILLLQDNKWHLKKSRVLKNLSMFKKIKA